MAAPRQSDYASRLSNYMHAEIRTIACEAGEFIRFQCRSRSAALRCAAKMVGVLLAAPGLFPASGVSS